MRDQPPVTVPRRAVGLLLSSALLAALLVAGIVEPAHAATVTESEPNAATSSANVVAAGNTVTGSTSSTSTSDTDYYAFDVAADGRLNIDFRFPAGLGAGDMYDVDVYTSAGTRLYAFDVAGDYSDGKTIAASAMFVPKGRVYVSVSGSKYSPSWGKAYTLKVTSTPGVVETEVNSATATADVVALGGTVSGSSLTTLSSDTDYYAFDVAADGRLNVDFRFPAGLGAGDMYDVDVYNSAGTRLYAFDVAGDYSDGKTIAASAMFVPKGRVYVSVSGSKYSPSWGKAYTLKVTSTPGVVETEVNSATATADVVALGGTVSGSSLTTLSSDTDYYAFDVAADGRLNIDFRFPAGLGAGDMYDVDVYNSAGTRLYAFDVAGDYADGKSIAATAMFVPKGRVYVSVSGSKYSPSWGKPYTLKVTSTPGVVETEINSATATADVVALGGTISGSSFTTLYNDVDYFAFDIPSAGRISLNFKYPTGLGAGKVYDVSVLNAAGKILYSYDLIGDEVGGATGAWLRSQPIDLPKGRAYVLIEGDTYKASWGQPYTLSAGYSWTATPAPKITGTATVGSTLTAKAGTWAPAPGAIAYKWLRNGKAIVGATKATYKLVTADAGSKITVSITASKTGYAATTKTSVAVSIALLKLKTTPTPKITGSTAAGSTLTAVPGAWTPAPVVIGYKWLRDGKVIVGATKSTYKTVAADKGKKITVTVTGSKTGYTSVAKTSVAVTVPAK